MKTIKTTQRRAESQDYEFLFALKKSAEYAAVEAVFGWDEKVQRAIHRQEWQDAKPKIIEWQSQSIGSFLVTEHSEHLYFGRFFLMPEFHSMGIGGNILNSVTRQADEINKPIKLCYLNGNRVSNLYSRHGFEEVHRDAQFVTMIRKPLTVQSLKYKSTSH